MFSFVVLTLLDWMKRVEEILLERGRKWKVEWEWKSVSKL